MDLLSFFKFFLEWIFSIDKFVYCILIFRLFKVFSGMFIFCVKFLLFVLFVIIVCVNWFILFKYIENF